MKQINQKLSVLLSFSLLVGCSSISPSASQNKQVALRPMQEKTLANGLKILYINDNSLPRVSYHLLVQAGSAQDPVGVEGLSALTVSMLEQGTAKKSSLQVADDFAQLGSSFQESASSDYIMASTAGLSEYKERLLALFADVILNPSFAKQEFERKRSQMVAELTQLPDQPTEYASELYDQVLFGTHPYAHPVSGTVASVKKMKRDQIAQYYASVYRPNNSMLAVVGNFDEAFKAQVEKTFEAWKQAPVQTRPLPQPILADKMKLQLFSKAGLQQTQIRMGQIGIGRNDPDYLKLRLANVVLGGAFASRLNQKVRDDLGLTYSISSRFDSKMGTGSFEINTFARNEKVAEAIKSTMDVVKDFHKTGITDKELNAAKALLIGQFPAAIETADRLAFNLLALRVYQVPDSYLTDFFKNVNEIQLKGVNEAISKHFAPEKFSVVVYADGKAVQKELAEVGNFEIQNIK